MDRLLVITPALVLSGLMLLLFLVHCVLELLGIEHGRSDQRSHSRFFAFFIRYFLWILEPIERLILRSGLTPNSLTLTAIALSIGSAVAIVTGHMATAGWLYIAAAAMDIFDGRLARMTNQITRSGGFLDSVADRWCELIVISGFAYFLRDTLWLFAALGAIAGSVMVSYTRARGGEFGLKLDNGHLQRPERITILASGALITAFFEASRGLSEFSLVVIGVALTIVAVGSTSTAITRLVTGYRQLMAEDVRENRIAGKPRPVHGEPASKQAE